MPNNSTDIEEILDDFREQILEIEAERQFDKSYADHGARQDTEQAFSEAVKAIQKQLGKL